MELQLEQSSEKPEMIPNIHILWWNDFEKPLAVSIISKIEDEFID